MDIFCQSLIFLLTQSLQFQLFFHFLVCHIQNNLFTSLGPQAWSFHWLSRFNFCHLIITNFFNLLFHLFRIILFRTRFINILFYKFRFRLLYFWFNDCLNRFLYELFSYILIFRFIDSAYFYHWRSLFRFNFLLWLCWNWSYWGWCLGRKGLMGLNKLGLWFRLEGVDNFRNRGDWISQSRYCNLRDRYCWDHIDWERSRREWLIFIISSNVNNLRSKNSKSKPTLIDLEIKLSMRRQNKSTNTNNYSFHLFFCFFVYQIYYKY